LEKDARLFKWSAEKAADLAQLVEAGHVSPSAKDEPATGVSGAITPDETPEVEVGVEDPGDAVVEDSPGEVDEAPTEEAPVPENAENAETPETSKEKVEEAPKVTMSSIILPMLEAKKYTAEQIAEKVKSVFPEKYSDEKAFKKLVQQIKGPRLYNARKAGKDVALVASK